jgi:hypothetical protein
MVVFEKLVSSQSRAARPQLCRPMIIMVELSRGADDDEQVTAHPTDPSAPTVPKGEHTTCVTFSMVKECGLLFGK